MIVIDSVLFFLLVLLICEHALRWKSMNGNFLKKVRHLIQIFCPDFKAGWYSAIKILFSLFSFLNPVRTLFRVSLLQQRKRSRRALEFLRKNKPYNIQCTVSNYFTWMTQVFWILKNWTLLKTRCYVINLFFINQNMESAVFLYNKMHFILL